MTKRARSAGPLCEDASNEETPASPAKETEEVKEVTKGVKDVELEDKEPSENEGPLEDPKDDEKAEGISSSEAKADNAEGQHVALDEVGKGDDDVTAENVPLPDEVEGELQERPLVELPKTVTTSPSSTALKSEPSSFKTSPAAKTYNPWKDVGKTIDGERPAAVSPSSA